MKHSFTVRPFVPEDAEAVGRIFRRAVHQTAAKDYAPRQLDAWAPENRNAAYWQAALLPGSAEFARSYVVADQAARIAAFGNFIADRSTALTDHLFVDPDCARMGVGSMLLRRMEEDSLRRHFTATVSLTARPFFERHGWHVLDFLEISRNGATLPCLQMEKCLG